MPHRNSLLRGLTIEERARVRPSLEELVVHRGDVLLHAHTASLHVFFPVTAVLSIVQSHSDGSLLELAVVGREGGVGLDIFLGAPAQPNDVVVQGDGIVLRMDARSVLREFALAGRLQRRLLRFTHALIGQISQTSICNHSHTIAPRLSKWLLMIDDRLPDREIRLTQKFISAMLGVRLAGVNQAFKDLRSLGVVRQRRGVITISDRAGLERVSCECYVALVREYAAM